MSFRSSFRASLHFKAELKISEIPDSQEEIVLYNDGSSYMNYPYRWMALRKPILIKSGVMYKIQMPTTTGALKCTLLKPQVEVQSDFTVQFCPDSPDDAYMVGSIEGLAFIRF